MPRIGRRFLTENLATKGLALCGAFLLWVAVSFLGTRTLTVQDVPVGVVGLSESLALTSLLEPVDVKIRAPRSLLRQQDMQRLLRAFVDVAGRSLGAQSGEVTVSPGDPRIDIVVVLPARVNFTLEPVVQRSLPVTVVPEGTPAEGYRLGDATLDPKTIPVRGALGLLQQTPAIDVPVPVQGATTALEGEYPVRPPAGLTALTDRVKVKLEIVQSEEVRTFGIRVVTRGTPAAGYWIRAVVADPPVVSVRGPRDVFGEKTFLETTPVEVDEARASVERTVDLVLPSGVTLQGGEAKVRVRVDLVPLEGSREITAALQVSDVPDGLRVTTVSPASIRVTVRGSGETFDRLQSEEVRVVVSASGRSAGTFSVRPSPEQVRVPSGVQVVSVEGVDVSLALE